MEKVSFCVISLKKRYLFIVECESISHQISNLLISLITNILSIAIKSQIILQASFNSCKCIYSRLRRRRSVKVIKKKSRKQDKNVIEAMVTVFLAFLRFLSGCLHTLLLAIDLHRYIIRLIGSAINTNNGGTATMMTPCYRNLACFVCVTAQDDARKNTIIVIVRPGFRST